MPYSMTQQLHKPYFENLDALRFFAFLNVFIAHCQGIFGYSFSNKYAELAHKHFFFNGHLGVSFFFVLSGFLITWLLLNEKDRNTKINIGAFYMRRILRIWPVYFLVLIVGFAIGFYLHSPALDQSNFNYHADKADIKWYVLFLANYVMFSTEHFSSLILGVLWSVSVEEQFYLVWPLLFLFLPNKRIPAACIVVIAISFIFRCFSSDIYSSYSTFSAMSYLAIGGLMAYHSRYSPAFTGFFKNLRKGTIIRVYVLLFLYIPAMGFSHYFGETAFRLYHPFEGLILAALFSFVILEQIYAQHSFFKFGNIGLLNKLGRISYGLYAYHAISLLIVLLIVPKFGISDTFFGYLIKIIFAFLLTVTGSFLSYRFMEKKVLSLKKYFQPA